MFNVGDIIKRKESEVDEWYLSHHSEMDRFKVISVFLDDDDGIVYTHDDNGCGYSFYTDKMELVSARYGMP